MVKAPFRMIGAFWCKFWCNTGYPTIIKKGLENKSPLPIIDMNKERDYVTVIIPINEYFDEEKLSLRDKIIDTLKIKIQSWDKSLEKFIKDKNF